MAVAHLIHAHTFRLYVGVLGVNTPSRSLYLRLFLPLMYFPSFCFLHSTKQLSSLCVCDLQVESTSRPDLVLFLIKYLMMLIVGIPSVFWVGSKKTCFEWASFFHGKRRKEYVVYSLRQTPLSSSSASEEPL